MLTVLYGPSCVGKTSIQEVLIADHHWHPVRCFTTRAARLLDTSRIHIPLALYNTMRAQNAFLFDNVHFNEHYGTSADDINEATSSTNKHFVLDFRIQDYKQLMMLHHKRILISVDNEEQLKRQVALAGRESRLAAILSEYREYYSPSRVADFESKGFVVVVNRFGELKRAGSDVLRLWASIPDTK